MRNNPHQRVATRSTASSPDSRKSGGIWNRTRKIDFESLERDLGILDELFVDGLRTAIPPEHLAIWEQEAKKELKVYKKRLPKDVFQKIRENYMRQKVHKAFSVGDLSLFHL